MSSTRENAHFHMDYSSKKQVLKSLYSKNPAAEKRRALLRRLQNVLSTWLGALDDDESPVPLLLMKHPTAATNVCICDIC